MYRALPLLAVLLATLVLAAPGCASRNIGRAPDPAGLVPEDFDGCVRGGGRLERDGRVCFLQINERLAPTAFAYCRASGGELRAVGSVSGLRSGNERGNVCTLTYRRETEADPRPEGP